MTSRPPPLPTCQKNEEKNREEILDRVEEGWIEEKEMGENHAPSDNQNIAEDLTSKRNPTATRTCHATEGEYNGYEWKN